MGPISPSQMLTWQSSADTVTSTMMGKADAQLWRRNSGSQISSTSGFGINFEEAPPSPDIMSQTQMADPQAVLLDSLQMLSKVLLEGFL